MGCGESAMPHLYARRSYLAAAVSVLVLGTLLSLGTILIVHGHGADCRIKPAVRSTLE